jgi:type IV secretory pathway TrbD component
VFVGGDARLVGAILAGYLSATVGFSLAMELLVAPGLMLWQMHLAQHDRF